MGIGLKMDSKRVPLGVGIVGMLIALGAVGLYSFTSQPTSHLSYSSSDSNSSQNWCGFPDDRTKLVLSGIEATFTAHFGSSWDLKAP